MSKERIEMKSEKEIEAKLNQYVLLAKERGQFGQDYSRISHYIQALEWVLYNGKSMELLAYHKDN